MIQQGLASLKLILLALGMGGTTLCVALAQDMPCYPPKHSPIPNILHLTYHKARKELLKAAWQPLRTKSQTAKTDEDPDIGSGNGPTFWEKEYEELEFCSGTGSAVCAFLFSDVYGNHLEVITEGEEIPENDAHAIVTRFNFVCSSKE